MMRSAAAKVIDVWLRPGPDAAYHRFRQDELMQTWPALAHALVQLSQSMDPDHVREALAPRHRQGASCLPSAPDDREPH